MDGISDPVSKIAENRQKYASLFSKTGSNDDLSMDTFYQLLTAEMTKQDPLEPMSNTEFISQMASFSSLKVQNDALYYNNANYAQSLVGKQVTVAAFQGTELQSASGIVTSMHLSNKTFKVVVNGSEYELSSIMEVMPSVTPYTATGADAGYAASLIGKTVTVSAGSGINKVVDQGEVEHVEIKDGEITLVINKIA
jgi:flagellar basal-body rod modification protein FlgD